MAVSSLNKPSKNDFWDSVLTEEYQLKMDGLTVASCFDDGVGMKDRVLLLNGQHRAKKLQDDLLI